MPRVLFLIRSLGRGGAERQLVALAAGLHRRGWRVVVACFYAQGPFRNDLERAGVPVVDLRKRGRWDVIGFFYRLLRLFKQTDPDIVHGYLTVSNLLALFARVARWNTRVVWGLRSSLIDRDRYDWLSRLTFKLSCKLARFADRVIVNSQAGAMHHAALGYPRARMQVIPNGVDTQRFRFDAEARRRLRQTWGVPDDACLVGLVGRIDPMKDHPTFLRAVAGLAKDDPDWRFVCVGGGVSENYAKEVRSRGAELGLDESLQWTGAHDDMAAVYSALDIAVSSSYGEGFSNIVAEAMACGRPCVVTDVGDSALIVGESGIVVAPKNPEALRDGIARMRQRLRADRETLAAAARARIFEHFSVNSLVERTAGVLLALDRRGKSVDEATP